VKQGKQTTEKQDQREHVNILAMQHKTLMRWSDGNNQNTVPQ